MSKIINPVNYGVNWEVLGAEARLVHLRYLRATKSRTQGLGGVATDNLIKYASVREDQLGVTGSLGTWIVVTKI